MSNRAIRIPLRVLGAAMLGAMTAILVALAPVPWSKPVVWIQPKQTAFRAVGDLAGYQAEVWSVRTWSSTGVLRIASIWTDQGYRANHPLAIRSGPPDGSAPVGPHPAGLVPSWATDVMPAAAEGRPTEHRVMFEARGWPLLCLKGTVRRDMPDPPRFIGAIGMSDSVSIKLGEPFNTRIVPVSPIWLYFAADTAAYATCWFALFSVPAVIRNLRGRYRRYRGCCPACAFRLVHNDTCPECGATKLRSS